MITTTKNSQDYMLVIWLECLKGLNQCFYNFFYDRELRRAIKAPVLEKIPYFLLREIRTEYFAKLNFALRSAKFAFREISVHCRCAIWPKYFFRIL